MELREEFFDDGTVFGDERMDAAAETGAVFVGQIFRRDDDDRSLDEARVAAEVVEEFEAVHARHHEVEQDERRLGLARRSAELCHAHNLDYDVTLRTDEQTTAESVEAIIAALQQA